MRRGLLGVLTICAALTASAAQGADRLAWQLSDEEFKMKLAYGQPNTDLVGLILRCHPETGIVDLAWQLDEAAGKGREVGAKWQTQLQLASGRSKQSYRVEVEQTELGPRATTDEPSAYDAPLKAFGKTGKISVDGTAQDARTGAERKAIRQFMDLCYEVAD